MLRTATEFDGDSDRENNNIGTKLERRPEIAIARDRKLGSKHRRLSTLINPNRQNSVYARAPTSE